MRRSIYSVIAGTGNYIPSKRIKNEAFLTHEFYDVTGNKFNRPNEEIIEKFFSITDIAERRHVTEEQVTSDIAFLAAEDALESTEIDRESLDYIIVAHNFGDVQSGDTRPDIVPSLAARVKHKLKIQNPNTVAYDIIFGCPGWLQGMIQGDYYIRSGDAKRVMVIGSDVLSRISDPYDRDSMLYADGAGAAILEAHESESPVGVLAHSTRSDTLDHWHMLYMGASFNPNEQESEDLFLKMNGRKLYQYALERVSQAIKDCLAKCNVDLSQIKKVLIHQANGKMDDAIVKRLFKLYKIADVPNDIMPMSISWLGNSSVATIPTLLDLILKGKMEHHRIKEGDKLVLASVGAGMNINAMVYQV